MTELKPCPFCKSGGDPRPSADDWGHKIIRCEYCGATAPGAQWNNRPTTGRARDLYEKRGLKELTEEQKTSNLEHNTGIEARPAPELPEGYRADGDIGLIAPNGNRFYMCDLEDETFWNLTREDVLALAAFLQGAR